MGGVTPEAMTYENRGFAPNMNLTHAAWRGEGDYGPCNIR